MHVFSLENEEKDYHLVWPQSPTAREDDVSWLNPVENAMIPHLLFLPCPDAGAPSSGHRKSPLNVAGYRDICLTHKARSDANTAHNRDHSASEFGPRHVIRAAIEAASLGMIEEPLEEEDGLTRFGHGGARGCHGRVEQGFQPHDGRMVTVTYWGNETMNRSPGSSASRAIATRTTCPQDRTAAWTAKKEKE